MGQAIGGRVVKAVVQADPLRVEPAQRIDQRRRDALVVDHDLLEDAAGADIGRIIAADDRDALAGCAEDKRRLPGQVGADDHLDTGIGANYRLAHKGQPAVQPGLGQ
jgi:hypothetical protein